MSALPLAVRVALWATHAWARGDDLPEALRHAHAGVTDVLGPLVETLEGWHAAGERVAVAALPRPGALHGMPSTAPPALAAALDAGECVLAPTVGGLLVPELRDFGPPADRGLLATWAAHPADPVPRHRLEALDGAAAAQRLAEAVTATSARLERAGGIPWRAREAGARQPGRLKALPPLPDGIPARALVLVERAATVLELAGVGLAVEDEAPAVDAATSATRARLLRGLAAEAAAAVAEGAGVAALRLAAQARPSTSR